MSEAPLDVPDGVAALRVSVASFFTPRSPPLPPPPLLALGDGAAVGAATAAEVAAADVPATPAAAVPTPAGVDDD